MGRYSTEIEIDSRDESVRVHDILGYKINQLTCK